jgi:hypothetical protein
MSAAAGASAAAAAARRRQEQEEEEMTFRNTDPSGAVEYKFIRSATGAFKDPAVFRVALDEEALAGWELVEKLDDSRARLRRSIECRTRDAQLDQDPYRIQVGLTESALVLRILLGTFVGIAVFVGLLIGIIALVSRR